MPCSDTKAPQGANTSELPLSAQRDTQSLRKTPSVLCPPPGLWAWNHMGQTWRGSLRAGLSAFRTPPKGTDVLAPIFVSIRIVALQQRSPSPCHGAAGGWKHGAAPMAEPERGTGRGARSPMATRLGGPEGTRHALRQTTACTPCGETVLCEPC